MNLERKRRFPERYQDADLPEVAIVPAAGTVSYSGRDVEQLYEIRIVTGDIRASALMFPIKWAIIKAIEGAVGDNLGLSFVATAHIEGFADNLEPGPENRGIQGWTTSLPVRVRFHFDTSWKV